MYPRLTRPEFLKRALPAVRWKKGRGKRVGSWYRHMNSPLCREWLGHLASWYAIHTLSTGLQTDFAPNDVHPVSYWHRPAGLSRQVALV
jgi:hypothetical protein